jgi:hypothetical protein
VSELEAYLLEQSHLSLNETQRTEIINEYKVSSWDAVGDENEGGDEEGDAEEAKQSEAASGRPPLSNQGAGTPTKQILGTGGNSGSNINAPSLASNPSQNSLARAGTSGLDNRPPSSGDL